MQTYEILVQNRAVKGNSRDMTLVRTSVGIDQVHILFDSEEWLEFPITITFAQGDDIITQSLLVTAVDSTEWVAESTVTIPYEVIDMTGPIRVTLQGTDASGRHIITAKGSPLSVEEAGDAVMGEPPADAPSIDQWQQAYSQAMTAASNAQGEVEYLRGKIDELFGEFEERMADMIMMPIATTESIGGVIIGDNINVEDGVISVDTSSIIESASGMTANQTIALANLSNLAYQCFVTEFDQYGRLKDNASVKRTVLPLASRYDVGVVMVDGSTITIDSDGVISSPTYVLPAASHDTLGGVKIGYNMSTDALGNLVAKTATAESVGVVRPDGETITIDDGVLTATYGGADGYILPKAGSGQLGGVMVGNGLAIDESGVLSVSIDLADGMEF